MLASGVLVDLEKVEAEMSWRDRMSIFEIRSSWDWLGSTRDTKMD